MINEKHEMKYNEKFYNCNNEITINEILHYKSSDFLLLSFRSCKNFMQSLIIKISAIFMQIIIKFERSCANIGY